MRLTVLGSNGTYPTPGRPASGYLVDDGDTVLMLDCGPGTFPALLARGEIPDAIVVTHRHGDHCLDLLSLFNYLRFDRADVRGLPLYAPDGVYRRLADFAGAGDEHAFHRAFDHRTVAPGDRFEVGGIAVGLGAVAHPVPAVCVGLTAGGRRLLYSGDTGPGGDVAVMASGADLLLCEATHQGPVSGDRYPYHLYASEAGQVAASAGVGRLVLTHLGPTLDPAVSIAEAAAVFNGPVAHAEPGMEVDV